MVSNKQNSIIEPFILGSEPFSGNVSIIDGLENFISTYEEVVSGRINPNEGIIVNLKNA